MTQHNGYNLIISALAAQLIKFGKNTVKGVPQLIDFTYFPHLGPPLKSLPLKPFCQSVMVFPKFRISHLRNKTCAYIMSKSLPAGSWPDYGPIMARS